MLTIRVVPRRGIALRAATASAEVSTALAVGHVWAGGTLPSAAWLAAMAGVVFGAGLLVLRGRVRPRVAVPALVATQLLLHAWLTALTAASGHHAAAGHHTPPGGHLHQSDQLGHLGHLGQLGQLLPVLDPAMLAVHVGAGLLTALLWELRARAVDVVVAWTRLLLPAPRNRPHAVVPATSVAGLTRLLVVTAAPRRGPPVAAVL